VLDEKMVWNLFVWECSRYYLAVTRGRSDVNLIEQDRQTLRHTAIYRECEWLYNRIVAVDVEENSAPYTGRGPSIIVSPGMAGVVAFLEQEARSGRAADPGPTERPPL
jgi:hypothetical protein